MSPLVISAEKIKHAPLAWDAFYNIINGRQKHTPWTRRSINPATEEKNTSTPVSTEEDVTWAMHSAVDAFEEWAATPYADRQKAVFAFADAVVAETEGFSKLLVQEQGKPYVFAQTEVDAAARWMRATASLELPVERTEVDDRTVVVKYTPLGVVVGLVPWNYPVLLAAGKIAAAVVTGNTIIIKPSPYTPASGLKLCELAQNFFPPGVVQCLAGDDSLGIWLTEHPIPAKISFTGSTATGKKVMASASKTLKRVTLELGGKDPAIVCEDVDIEDVASKIATFAFLNSGQICLAIKRIYVHEKIIDKFREVLVNFVKTLKVGEGNEKDVFLGPLQNSMQYERVKCFFDDIEIHGQTPIVGGTLPPGKGYFIHPTIIDNPAERSRIVTEEQFGPIVPLLSFATDEEAIRRANDTHYGLGASVWSSNIERANAMAEKIEAGTVWVNAHFKMDPIFPFGGHKESGIGTEQGVSGLKSYCNSQTLYLGKI